VEERRRNNEEHNRVRSKHQVRFFLGL